MTRKLTWNWINIIIPTRHYSTYPFAILLIDYMTLSGAIGYIGVNVKIVKIFEKHVSSNCLLKLSRWKIRKCLLSMSVYTLPSFSYRTEVSCKLFFWCSNSLHVYRILKQTKANIKLNLFTMTLLEQNNQHNT